jgi:hypothetical protein
MLGYNDMAANQDDGSAVMKGFAQAGGMAIFNQLLLPLLFEKLGANAESVGKYASDNARRFLYASDGGARQFIREKLHIADVDELADEEDETRQAVAKDYQLNVLRYFHSIENYLLETLDDRLTSMIDLLGEIRSNTERHEPPDDLNREARPAPLASGREESERTHPALHANPRATSCRTQGIQHLTTPVRNLSGRRQTLCLTCPARDAKGRAPAAGTQE